jgi:hypothetical protein
MEPKARNQLLVGAIDLRQDSWQIKSRARPSGSVYEHHRFTTSVSVLRGTYVRSRRVNPGDRRRRVDDDDDGPRPGLTHMA